MANEALYDEELEPLTDEDQDASPEAEHAYADDRQASDERPAADDWADPAADPTEAADDAPPADTLAPDPIDTLDPLDQLPIALTLRCGHLALTLGDLRHIAAGTVLEVSGVAPGHATLCHGDRVVAEGELVDVDGRLGLQITRMASPA
ncbi:FliM/FliN family flagellar motor switch protein [Pseudomonas sp. UBA1879]|uniref:FliM/FliN family flagellar motor switch protein n=1 Tax=Pseudomonas sp. UBA1879 TaxID=1947305 RepID=UPI0025D88AEA|nr:FliM/FliN family flagellar motor switch protein [Pseudomonas sp. UBA1879]